MVDQVLTPLLHAFVRARDLTGFIYHWRDRLAAIHQKSGEDSSGIAGGVWTGEALFGAVSAQIGRLTPPQINTLVQKLLIDRDHSNEIPSHAIPFADVVVLGSVINGLSREETINYLAKEAQSAYCILLANITNPANPGISYRWRFWQTATSIAQRWPVMVKTEPIRTLSRTAICHAMILLNSIPKWQPDDDCNQTVFTEHYQAFVFILHFASQRHRFESEGSSSREIAEEATRKLIDVIQPLSQRVDNDIWGTFYLQEDKLMRFGEVSALTSVDALYLKSIQTLLASPEFLGYANASATC